MNKVSKWNKQCPVCNCIQQYNKKSHLKIAIRTNSLCKKCSNSTKKNGLYKKTTISNFYKECSLCKSIQYYSNKYKLLRSLKNNQICPKCSYKNTLSIGQSSNFQKIRYKNFQEREKTSNSVKQSMHKPDIRKKHIEGLYHSKWIKVKTDKGQLELLEKWNKLGFNFEPNYQIKTNTDLFYVDGYDKEKNTVLEYDSKYHNRPYQKEKDLDRQQKIINILKPNRFWRFNSFNLTWRRVLP